MKFFHSVSCCLFALVVLLSSCSLHKTHCKEHQPVKYAAVEYTGEEQSSVAEDINSLQPIDPRSINITASLRGGDVLISAKEPCLKTVLGVDSHE